METEGAGGSYVAHGFQGVVARGARGKSGESECAYDCFVCLVYGVIVEGVA